MPSAPALTMDTLGGRVKLAQRNTWTLVDVACGMGLALLAACGPVAEPPQGTTPNDPVGTWQSDCLPPPNTGISTFHISSSRWTLDFVKYAMNDCSQPMFTVHVEGPWALGKPSTAVAGANEATFGFTKKTITPQSAAGVWFLSSLAGCKDASFKEGEATDILAGGCSTLGQHPVGDCAQDFDLVAVDGGHLWFGARPSDNNMCTQEKRPTQLASWASHLLR